MPYDLTESLTSAWPPERWRDTTVIVAVSGGADSVALLCGVQRIKSRVGGTGRLIAAHFNHQFRGSESDDDATFVRQLCQTLNLPIEVGVRDPNRTDPAGQEFSSEEAARAMRYEFLCETASASGARYVATAHTSNDQAETVLHRVIRGTGLQGLGGIPATRELIHGVSMVRPMLNVSREQVLAYLAKLGQAYRHDSSNESTTFTRNRIRHELIPLLERDYNPRCREALCRLAELAREVNELIDIRVQSLLERCVLRATPATAVVACDALAKEPPYIVRESFVRLWNQRGWPVGAMTRDKWDQLYEFACGQPLASKLVFPGNVLVERSAGELHLRCQGGQPPPRDAGTHHDNPPT